MAELADARDSNSRSFGIVGPIDGMEDYEYFAILESLADRKTAKKIVDTVAPNWWDFSKDPDEFLVARKQIAQQILKLK